MFIFIYHEDNHVPLETRPGDDTKDTPRLLLEQGYENVVAIGNTLTSGKFHFAWNMKTMFIAIFFELLDVFFNMHS